MTTATVPLSPRRTRMLGHLAEHPRTTAYELGKALGLPGRLGKELEDMQSRGLVVSDTEWRSSMGRNVRVWSEAPAGTPVPSRPRLSQAELRRRRERDTRTNRARRARMRAEAAGPRPTVPPLPPAIPPCTGNPALFFPDTEAEEAQAIAICRGCPLRQRCLARALANGEVWGIWGGHNFEHLNRNERNRVS